MKDIYIYILCCICSAYLEASSFQESKGFQEYRTVLSIAGSDPSGGAGIQADLKTFSALQCYGMSAITALTAQNTVGVQAIQSLPSPFITAQLKSIFEDIKVNSVKIGMLERVEVIQAVADYLNTYWKDQGPIVVDPVMFAKSGDQLIEDEAIEALKETILPLATILTPNIHEACRLLRISQITTKLEMEEAAFALLELGPEAVVLKGAKGKDCLVMKGDIQPYWLEHEYILTSNVHGTGCAFSAAIASYLAQGEDIFNSVKKGKIYISKAIEGGSRYKLGKGKGPVLHFFSWSPSHFTESAWNGVDSIYDKIKHHTFIQEMGLGLLSKDRFSFYIAQDYLFY